MPARNQTRRPLSSLFVLGLLALSTGLSSCDSSINHPSNPNVTPPLSASPNVLTVSQGFSPGAGFSGTIVGSTVAAGTVPFAAGNRTVSFVVFTSEDGGGQQTISVAAVNNLSSTGLPTAFSQALVQTFQNDRCQNCHGFPEDVTLPSFDTPGDGVTHTQDVTTDCSSCHDPAIVGVQVWRAPLSFPELRAVSPQFGTGVLDLRFRGKTSEELVATINNWEMLRQDATLFPTMGTIEDAMDHFMADERIFWGVDDGRVPLGRPTKLTPSIEQGRFIDLLESWNVAGRPATAESALLSGPFLLSQVGGVAPATGNSHSASATFVPQTPVGMTIGTLVVTFVSNADTLVAGSSGPAGLDQVYRARVLVNLDGADQLSFQIAGIDLVSHAAGALTQRANNAAGRPSVSADGRVVAFESLATDLVAGFIEQNQPTEPDVYAVVSLGQPILVSADASSSTTGGNSGSFSPNVSAGGGFDAVAFETDATNLLPTPDTNGVRDIVFAEVAGAVGNRRRVSVQTGGAEATGGDSSHASLTRRDGVILVTFQSTKSNLTSLPSGGVSQIYLYDDQAGDRTTLISQNAGSSGNGSSTNPVLSPSGMELAFETLAMNLDTVRTVDSNGASDVVRVGLADFLAGGVLEPLRLSISNDGVEADAASVRPQFTSSIQTVAPLVFETEVLSFDTEATNLGRESGSNAILAFVGSNYRPICRLEVTSSQIEIMPGVLRALEDLPIDFSAAESRDLNGDTLTYNWNFGDGTPDVQGETATHSYMLSGMFTTTLTATDPQGATSVCTLQIQVDETNDVPVAVLDGPYAMTATGIPNNFNGSGSTDEDGIISTYDWRFEAPGETPLTFSSAIPALNGVVFTQPGTYQVQLVVTDNDGAVSAPALDTIVVVANNDPVITSVTLSPTSTTVTEGQTRTFTANVTDEDTGSLVYNWNVGTGTLLSAPGSVVTVRFDTPGSTSVSVQVTDFWGATDTSTPIGITVDGLITFSVVYDMVIQNPTDGTASCGQGGCHNSGGQTPRLTGGATAVRNTLLTQDPSCSGTLLTTAYVDPNDANNSVFYRILLGTISGGTCGGGSLSMMPQSGGLTPNEIQLVEQWIDQGAN